MGVRAFLFPGQGSQEIGMGCDLIGRDPFTDGLLAEASDLVHEDLPKLCLHGPARRLMEARFLQPSIVSVSLGYWMRLTERAVRADVVLGHSLGEITALAAAGIVTPQESLRIATKRGQLMDMVADKCDGGMMALLFVERETLSQLLDEFGGDRRIVLANDNALQQVVVSGEVSRLDALAERITATKCGKCRRVDVVGPWHSPFMEEAQSIFAKWVESIEFAPPSIPLVFNGTSDTENDPSRIRELLTRQLTGPVLWRQSMTRLRQMGVDTFFEIGPQRVLSGLLRINGFNSDVPLHSIGSIRGIERLAMSTLEISAA